MGDNMASQATKAIKRLPLKDAPPQGRLDVVAYKVSQRLVEKLEAKTGMVLWPSVGGYVEEIINEVIPADRIQLPSEVNMIINILRKNGMEI